jgi:outer membrane receptor for ferrienterochelin and colicin
MKTRTQGHQRLYGPAIASALVSAVALPTAGWAQTVDATLRGKAAGNAEIVARNVATGATRRTKADADGNYTLLGLPAGTYRVSANGTNEQAVTLSVASIASLDLTQSGAAIAADATLEEVIVRATRLVEVRTSEVGTTVSQEQIAQTPQVTRNFLEFADTVPGMAFSVDSDGNTSLRGGAQNNAAVNVFIDGVGQKSYVMESGVSGQFFSQGNPFPQLAIGEYKVITSNYKAEYDQITSAAITAETKSGTNQLHGEVFGLYTNQGLRAPTPSELNSGDKIKSTDKEYGFSVGGPIIRDQLHFFFTYEGKKYDKPTTVLPQIIGIDNLLPASVVAEFGPSSLPFTENLYFGKLDWEVSDADRLEFSFKVRQEDQIKGIGTGNAPSASIDTKNNDSHITMRWQHSADKWQNELLFTYEDTYYRPSARSNGNGAVYTYGPQNNAFIINTGPPSPLATQNKAQKGPGLQDDFTLHGLHWKGDHTVKFGAKFKEIDLTAADAQDGNPQYTYNVDLTGTSTTPYKVFFAKPVAGTDPSAKSKTQQFGLYIQDDWATTDKLTLNLGLRWDYEKNPGYDNFVTPANAVAALKGPDPNAPGQTYAHSLALGGINVDDYISTGSNRKPYMGAVQPRLGFSYDINADQRHVVFGGAGRSYDRDSYNFLQVEQTKGTLPQFTYYFSAPGQACSGAPCVAWDSTFLTDPGNLKTLVSASNAGTEVDLINNNIKPPHSDQFSIGIRNKLGDWNTSATLARIMSYDGLAFTLGNRRPDGTFWLGGGQPWGNGVPGFGALIVGNSGIETRTTQLLLSAEKPYTEASHWGATFAYTYTSAQQNRDINEHYSFDGETIQQYPFILSNAAPRHRLVSTATLHGAWDVTYGVKLTLATPTPVDGFACFNTPQASGANCVPAAGTAQDLLGYRQLDLQATKNFEVAPGHTIWVRFDALNILDSHNYADSAQNFSNGTTYNQNPIKYVTTGNIVGVPATLRISAGYRF